MMNPLDPCIGRVPGYASAMLTVTPALAQRWLERNTHNRKIRPTVVEKYASELLAGEWRAVPSGIGFDEDGVLIDGQHRLAAIVTAMVPAPLLVVTGFPRSAQEKCDRHTRRSLFDVMRLAGHDVSRPAVQACTVLARIWINTGRQTMTFGPPPDHVIKDMLTRYGASASAVAIAGGNSGIGGSSYAFSRAGCVAAFTLWHKRDPSACLTFRKLVLDGTAPCRNHPASTLARSISSSNWYCDGKRFGVGRQEVDYRKCMYAISAAIDGREVRNIRAFTGAPLWAI